MALKSVGSVSSGGTVSSVGLTSTDLTVSGSPVTGAGNITANLNTQAGVAPGSFTNANITVNSKGVVTAVANGTAGTVSSVGISSTGNTISVTGSPVTGSGTIDVEVASVPATALPALTGDVTSAAGSAATTIANNAVTNAKAAQMAANTIKGNNTGSTANAADLTVAQALTLLGLSTKPNPVLAQSGIAFVVPSSGTIGNNGALSAITALPRTISTGAYFYFPSGAISSGSAAGWYWTVMSSTTAGTIYNSTYTSGQPEVGSTTAFSTTGPGAYTQTTGVLNSAGIGGVSVPGNTLGVNGRIETMWLLSMSSSAGSAKFLYMNYGGTYMGELQTSNAITAAGGYYTMTNRGVTNGQVVLANISTSESGIFGTGSVNIRSVDSTQAQTYQMYLGISTAATDFVILESFSTKVYPAS